MSKVIIMNVTTGKELLWRSIKVRKSLDEICHTLELETPPSERLKVKRHNRLEVRCENSLVRDSGGLRRVTTVLVDEVTATADAAKHNIIIMGRSPARDIIDSTWSGDYYNQKLGEITRQIGDKFGISLSVFPTDRPDSSDLVPSFSFENESPWTKLIDEADQQGFIFTSNEAGNLYLWRVPGESNTTKPFHVTEGINVKSVRWVENGSEQFHEYIVKGCYDTVREIDNSCPGNRVLTIDITDPLVAITALERRAKTEMRRRKETKAVVTVPGWGLTNEQIKNLGETNKREIYWVPNTLIPVKLPSLGLSANLLISEIEQTATAESMNSEITLVKREMYL